MLDASSVEEKTKIVQSISKELADNIIHLSELDVFKINIIQSALEEEVSPAVIVSGMLDQGFTTAIWVLNRDGKITPDALNYALELVPTDLKDQVLLKVANPPKKSNLDKHLRRLDSMN